jgi:hypothetical protein
VPLGSGAGGLIVSLALTEAMGVEQAQLASGVAV